jgi:D-alanine transaminase
MSLSPELQNRLVYLNGEMLPLKDAKVSVLDRGFIFGDGIYEVVAVYNKTPFRLEQHLDRLERSLDKIKLKNPLSRQGWKDLIAKMVASLPDKDQFVYFQITRGVAERDFGFPKDSEPTLFAITSPFKPVPQRQREGGLTMIKLPDLRWLRCDVKVVSLLGAVLAKQDALDEGVDDCIMFRDGFLTESSSANVWIVKDGTIYAPPRDNLILEGIRYGLMQEISEAAGIPFQVKRITEAEVDAADEILVTSATREVIAATVVNGKPVGKADYAGKPGPVYHKFYAAYQDAKKRLCG